MNKCPKCNSEKIEKTGIVYYSCPEQIEYICKECNEKFTIEGEGIKELTIKESFKKHPTMYLKQYFPCCFRCDHYKVSKEKFHCNLIDIDCLPIDVCCFFQYEKKHLDKEDIKCLYNDVTEEWLDLLSKELI